jgi:ribosomal protein L7/L12
MLYGTTAGFALVALPMLMLAMIVLLFALARLMDVVNGVNRKVDLLMKHSGMNVQEVANREALVLMREGKKIDAIKRYRELTGAGLAEAKAAVERLTAAE